MGRLDTLRDPKFEQGSEAESGSNLAAMRAMGVDLMPLREEMGIREGKEGEEGKG